MEQAALVAVDDVVLTAHPADALVGEQWQRQRREDQSRVKGNSGVGFGWVRWACPV